MHLVDIESIMLRATAFMWACEKDKRMTCFRRNSAYCVVAITCCADVKTLAYMSLYYCWPIQSLVVSEKTQVRSTACPWHVGHKTLLRFSLLSKRYEETSSMVNEKQKIHHRLAMICRLVHQLACVSTIRDDKNRIWPEHQSFKCSCNDKLQG